MEPIHIGLIDDDPRAVAHLTTAMPRFNNRHAGRPIALAQAFAEPIGTGGVTDALARLADARGPMILFVDLHLGFTPAERDAVAAQVRERIGPENLTAQDTEDLADVTEGAALAMVAILNSAASPLLLVHSTPRGDPDVFSLLTQFGERHRRSEPGRPPDFACVLRPTDFDARALSDPKASADGAARLIEWSVEQFKTRLPRKDPIDTAPLLDAWGRAARDVAASGWFGSFDNCGLFDTPIPPPNSDPARSLGTSHDLKHWHPELFQLLDAARGLDSLRPVFAALDFTPQFPTGGNLDSFWPLSCLKTIEHQLPHRAMLFAAAKLSCPGLLSTPVEHQREIKLQRTGANRLEASTRVLAAVRVICEAFRAHPPEVYTLGEREFIRFVFTSEQKKVEEIALTAVTHTIDGKQKAGHPTGGSFTHCCEWLGKHAANFWVGRVRGEGEKRVLSLAVEFEEGRLQ